MQLNKEITEELKNKLLEEKIKLEKELERFASPTGVPGDFKTRFENIGTSIDENASEVEEYADNLALENSLEKQLQEINRALEKISAGTYGTCENCRQLISLERLRAYPGAKKCLLCE